MLEEWNDGENSRLRQNYAGPRRSAISCQLGRFGLLLPQFVGSLHSFSTPPKPAIRLRPETVNRYF
jgi:hypothetical protein